MIRKIRYSNYVLLIYEPYEGMAVWFLLTKDTDAKLLWGLGRSFEMAEAAGREAVRQEALNESSSRGNL